tara:strand:- start:66 stop:410 length:345 start_codon:yes stop_codon:yes gene_type:complete
MKQQMGRNRKVDRVIVNTVKNMVTAGTKDAIIASAFDISVATVQNIKRTDYNYGKYRKLVNNQMMAWKETRNAKTNNFDRATNVVVPIVADLTRLEEKIDLLLSKFNSVFPNTE